MAKQQQFMKSDSEQMQQGQQSHSGRQGRRQSGRARKPKRFEVNVPDKEVNLSDLKGYITAKGSSNDPNWYKNVPGLAEAYAMLPFNQQLGLQFNMLEATETGQATTGAPYISSIKQNPYVTTQITGLATFEILPTIGISDTPNSAANIAAQQIFTLCRKANSGFGKNYDKPDLMMLIIAMDSAYMLYEDMVRAWRMLGSYITTNRYLPNGYLTALGYSPKLVSQYKDFQGLLEMFAFQLSSIPVPDEFDVIRRHSWLFSNIYKDAESGKAQGYAFVPKGLYIWTEGATDAPTQLQYYSMLQLRGSQTLFETVDQLQAAINTVMEPLLGSQDVGVISGDLMKAFGDTKTAIKITVPTTDSLLYPVYNREVLYQIMNADVTNVALPATTSASSFANITQSLEDLGAGPWIKHVLTPVTSMENQCSSVMKKLINMHTESPSVDEVLVATRYQNTIDPETMKFTSYGTEIITGMKVWAMETVAGVSTGKVTGFELYQHLIDYVTEKDEQSITMQLNRYESQTSLLAQASQFDWFPTEYRWESNGVPMSGAIEMTLLGFYQDIENVNFFDHSIIAKLNEICVLSEFTCKSYPSQG